MKGMSRPVCTPVNTRQVLGAVCVAAVLSIAAGSNIAALRNETSPLLGLDKARGIVDWKVSADDSPMGIVMAGATLANGDVLANSTGPEGALGQWKGKTKAAAKAAMEEVIEEIMQDNPDSVSSLGKEASTYKELQAVMEKAKRLAVQVPNIAEGGAASAKANSKAEYQAAAVAQIAASEADIAEAYDMPPPPEAASAAPFARKRSHVGIMKHQRLVVPNRAVDTRRARLPAVKMLPVTRKVKGASYNRWDLKRAQSAPQARLMSLDSNMSALRNETSPLLGLDKARGIVDWKVSADDSPMGIVMAGATLANGDVLANSTGPEGALGQWKGKTKAAAKAAMEEVIEEIMQDNPDSVSSLGKEASTYKELQAVMEKAKRLAVQVPNIAEGGAASAKANSKAEYQAAAVAQIAASEADIAEAYDMPPPPEAASAAPFARKRSHVGIMKHQRLVVATSAEDTHPRARLPAVKMLPGTRKVKGAWYNLEMHRAVESGGVWEESYALRSQPLARLVSLDEDADAPTEEEKEEESTEGDEEEAEGEEADAVDTATEAGASREAENPPCATGTTGPDGGPCVPCPKNMYKDKEGAFECTACPQGTRTARLQSTSLKDCWDGPLDTESPMGMVMAGPKLEDPEIQNKSVSSEAMELWKSRVGGAARKAVEEVKEEVLEDDPCDVVKGDPCAKGEQSDTGKELDDVISRARSLTISPVATCVGLGCTYAVSSLRPGRVELGGKEAARAKKRAEMQADAAALMAAHEAEVSDAWVDTDDAGAGPGSDAGAYGKREQRAAGEAFGHREDREERAHAQRIGYPSGNRPYYARPSEEEHIGVYPDASVGGAAHAYYQAKALHTQKLAEEREEGQGKQAARRAAGAMVRLARMQASTHAISTQASARGGRIQSLEGLPQRMQSLDALRTQSLDGLWEGIPADGSDAFGDPIITGGAAGGAQNVWIGAVPGESPQKLQVMEHSLEHQFLSANSGPVSLTQGTVATGSSSGAAGTAFTGVSDGPVWHTSWIASSDSSIAAPSQTFNAPPAAITAPATATPSYAKANKAGDAIAQQEAAALTPPGSGMRGPPSSSGVAGAGAGAAGGVAADAAGCSDSQIDLCHARCDSKLNLELQAIDPEYTSQHQWKEDCMSKCLGPCAKELKIEADQAASKIAQEMSSEENLINKLSKEFAGQGASGQAAAAAASVASDSIKHLQARIGHNLPDIPKFYATSAAAAATTAPTSSVWHGTAGAGGGTGAVAAGGAQGLQGAGGISVFPAAAAPKDGSQTGVYDCAGRAITVGALVGRMIPGRACEDQFLVVTAGIWKVTDFKQPGAAEVVQMRHGASTQGRVAVTLHGISPDVNKGTRVELVPFIGAFTHWKLVSGHTKDLFLPANVAAISHKGHHNVAGVEDPSGFTTAFHQKGWQNSAAAAAAVDVSGESKSESVISTMAQRDNDWGKTDVTERSDANLAMCPGPSCPSDGPSQAHRIMHLGNPFWKYIIAALVVGGVLGAHYLKRINDGVVPAGVLQQEYVQLPTFMTAPAGAAADGRQRDGSGGVELKANASNGKGGTRPCPGMKASDRIVMVENASDRIIMVDVGGSGGGAAAGSGGGGKSGGKSSSEAGYQ